MVPVAGPPIPAGTVLIRDGIIVAVGTDVTIPAGVPVVDVSGRWVLPGVDEEAQGWAGDDTNEMTSPNTAQVRALDAINIEDEGFRDALIGGVTTAGVKPGSGNPIGGRTVAIMTWGGRTVDEQVITDVVSVKSALGEEDLPVIYGPLLTSRSKVELRDRAIANLGVLARAGVRIAITTNQPVVQL